MFLRSAGDRPCAYIAYTRSARPRAGFDDVAVYFGGASPEASRAKVRGMLERSLEVSSVTEGGGEWPSMTVVARAKARILNATAGGGANPSPAPVADYFSLTATQVSGGPGVVDFAIYAVGYDDPSQLNIEYSLNSGASWQPFEYSDLENGNGIKVSNVIGFMNIGEKALLRGNNTGLGTSVWRNVRILGHSGGGTFQLSGDIRTLTDGNNPTGAMKPMASLFSDFFVPEVHIDGEFSIDASTLIMPEVLTGGCCNGMFMSSNISAPPTLSAETLACGCYNGMFTGTQFTASDDGENFNFSVGVTFPCTDSCGTHFETPKDLATAMGLTNNGFLL